MTIETYLPLFPGFYGTIYGDYNITEDDLWDDYTKVKSEYRTFIIENMWDYFDYETIAKDTVNFFISLLNDILRRAGFKAKFTFQKIVNPREYNYTNDSVNIKFNISQKEWQRIVKDIKTKHLSEFFQYIKNHYTSYSGFISSYTNNPDEWLQWIDCKLNDIYKKEHVVGSIMDFYFSLINDIDIEEAYLEMKCNQTDCNYLIYDKLILAVNEKFKLNIKKLEELEE